MRSFRKVPVISAAAVPPLDSRPNSPFKNSSSFHKIRLVYFCLTAFLLPATPSLAQTPEQVLEESAKTNFTIKEEIYKKIDTLTLKLKIYYPAAVKKTYPAMIFFFGGGWTGGSPSQFEPQARYFAARGMVTILADYRVFSRNKTTPFQAVNDAKSAVRYLRIHSRELHIDPTKIVASGGSAGGHLAAATDLTSLDEPGEDLKVSSRPNALVLFNPVFDNGPDGYGYERVKERYTEISPLHNIRKGAAPTIVFLGTKDKHIPVKTAELYKKKLEDTGTRCDLFLYPDQPHGFFNYKKEGNEYFLITLKEADRFLTSLGYVEAVGKL